MGDDDMSIANIINKITESVSKSRDKYTQEKKRDVVAMDEESHVITVMKRLVRSMTENGKEKQKEK